MLFRGDSFHWEKHQKQINTCLQVGGKFRSRALKFPGLISGVNMDWFQKWPKDALIAVSNHFLQNFLIVSTPEVKEELITIMAYVHDGVNDICHSYYERRVNFLHHPFDINFTNDGRKV